MNYLKIYLPIFLISFLYLSSFQNYGINLWDEGVLLNGSLRTMEGESVYVNFNGYPPGRYLLGGILFKLSGINITIIRTAVTIMTAAAVVMLYSISLRIIPPHPPLVPMLRMGTRYHAERGNEGRVGFALIPPILFLASPAVYYNRFYPIFTIFGIYVIFWYLDLQHVKTGLEKENPFRSAVLAISAIISLLFKIEIGVCIIIISITLLLFKKRLKEVKYFLLTLSLCTITLFLYYFQHLYIFDFFYDFYLHVFKIHGSWGNPFPNLFSLELWKRFDTYEIFSVILFYIPIIIYLLTFFILLRTTLTASHCTTHPLDGCPAQQWGPSLSPKGRGEGEGEFHTQNPSLHTHLAIILFFGIYTYNLVIWRTGFDNLIRCLPPAWILGGYLLYLLRMRLLKWTGERILSYAVVLLFPLWFSYMMVFYSDFYTGSIGEIRKGHTALSMERADDIYVDPIEASWIKEVTAHIKKNTSPEESIFAIPFNPIWYFLTDRKNPTYYEWILPGELKTEEGQGRVIEQLKKRVPSFIIYADIAIDNREERRFSSYAPLIYNFITENYHTEKVIGFFQIGRHKK